MRAPQYRPKPASTSYRLGVMGGGGAGRLASIYTYGRAAHFISTHQPLIRRPSRSLRTFHRSHKRAPISLALGTLSTAPAGRARIRILKAVAGGREAHR